MASTASSSSDTRSASMMLVGGRTALVGPASQEQSLHSAATAADLACVCALCSCGRHRCPVCYVPGATFAGVSTYRAHYSGAELPECPLDSREWVPNPPAPSPFLETEHIRNFTGHAVPATSRTNTQSLGMAATQVAAAGAVPFLGRTTYSTFYVDKGRRVPDACPEPPTILRAPLLLPALSVQFEGRSQQSRTHAAFKHLPATDFEMPPPVSRVALPANAPAPFEGQTAAAASLPAHAVDYATTRPAAFKSELAAAAPGAPFEAVTSHSCDVHDNKHGHRAAAVKVRKQFTALGETRSFVTQSAEELPPRELQADTTCLAARLGRPPSPSAAPGAWVGEHVLYDVATRTWAI